MVRNSDVSSSGVRSDERNSVTGESAIDRVTPATPRTARSSVAGPSTAQCYEKSNN